MESSNADYRSFLIRIWREGQVQKSGLAPEACTDQTTDQGKSDASADLSVGGWLLQVEDIVSRDRRYFNDLHALTDYLGEQIGTDSAP